MHRMLGLCEIWSANAECFTGTTSVSTDAGTDWKMDIEVAIKNLRLELQKINQAIATMESLSGNMPEGRKRGRKSMGADERVEVSKRMKKYWASKREARTA